MKKCALLWMVLILLGVTGSAEVVYVISNKKVENKYETFIYDFSGKLQKRTVLPLVDADPLELYPFAIHNNHIYQLIENDDEEIWQLHITAIQ